MINKCIYFSPIGKLTLLSKNNKLIGVHTNLEQDKINIKEDTKEYEDEILSKTKNWLDRYFKGEKPNINELDIEFIGTDFQKIVWDLLKKIPYRELTTYGELSRQVCKILNKSKMSSQAIGNAIGKNPIGIIVPCHRVVGSNGNLTGYASGLDIKIKLLEHEKVEMVSLYLPKKGNKNERKNEMQMV